MAQLEDLTAGAAVRGVLPDRPVSIVATQWFGSDALEVTYRDVQHGSVDSRLLFRAAEHRPPVAAAGQAGALAAPAGDRSVVNSPASIDRNVATLTARRRRPSIATEIAPVSSPTTTTTASASWLIPKAARWRLPRKRSRSPDAAQGN